MGFKDFLVTEIFHSLQGETSATGKRFAFIRLTGCNLRCSYCDSAYAFKGGTKMSAEEIINEIKSYDVQDVLLTGGEPLLQRNTAKLVNELVKCGYQVSIETHGDLPIDSVVKNARIIMDIKTPSSGMSRGGFRSNLKKLKPTDEVKFVIASKSDYFWARDLLKNENIPTQEILFSAVNPISTPLTPFEGVKMEWLAEQILNDKLNVRMQTQLHKWIWGSERRGV